MELSLDLSGPWTALKDATAVRAVSRRLSMTVEVLAHSEKKCSIAIKIRIFARSATVRSHTNDFYGTSEEVRN